MDAPIDAPFDGFLAEREAVSGLARRLSHGDVHAAEDLEQEVWTALLARPPREATSARGWLRAVTRTRAVERLRRRGRAGRAEREAARPEAVEGVDEACARRDQAERLARALRELDEPYRTVLALRFVEDLPPREVARRLGRPVETVRTQTRRGLALLRAKLEAREPRSPSWALLLAALRRPRVALPAALTVTAGLAVLALSGPTPPLASVAAAGARTTATAAPAAPEGAAPLAPSPTTSSAEFPAASPGAPLRWIELALRDGADAPLAGAEVDLVTHAGPRAAGRSDALGRLRVPLELADLASADGGWPLARDAAELRLRAPGLATRNVFVFLPERGAARVEASLAQAGRRLAGRVLDAAGRPLVGADVHAGPAAGLGARERLDPEGRALAVVRGRQTTTDAHGRFALEGLPCEPLTLCASAAGHALLARAVAADAGEAELTLAPAEALRGVARLGGRPVAGARVTWRADDGLRWPAEWCATRSDAAGRFELPRPLSGRLELEARTDGALAATELALQAGPAWWTAELAQVGELELRLLEPDGRPAQGLYLCLRASGGGRLLGTAESDAQGRARFAASRPGPYDLVVLPPRGEGGWPRDVLRELAPGGGERVLRLAPQPERSSAIALHFEAQRGARLELRHLAGAVEERASPGPDGRLLWQALPAGRWSARALLADGEARELGEFTLEPGRTLDLGRVE